MAAYLPGEVVLLLFPFTDATGAKQRPALILLDIADEDILVARITSQSRSTEYDVELADWQHEGLLRPSIVRVHKLATLEKRLVKRRLGALTPEDWTRVREQIRRLWAGVVS